jgi:hypothetical protein
MKNVNRHIHNEINYLVKYNTPTVGSFENWNTVHIAQLKLNSEVRNQIIKTQPMLIKEAILK